MEEKEVRNVENSAEVLDVNKLSHEDLKNVTADMMQRIRELMIENERLKNFINSDLKDEKVMKALHLLFKVLKYSEYFSTDFVTKCVEIIEKSLVTGEPKGADNDVDGENK